MPLVRSEYTACDHTMADEEPVNPQLEVEESCKPQCVKAWLEYEASGLPGAVRGAAHGQGLWPCRPSVLAAAACRRRRA